jgi:hypothetical protein
MTRQIFCKVIAIRRAKAKYIQRIIRRRQKRLAKEEMERKAAILLQRYMRGYKTSQKLMGDRCSNKIDNKLESLFELQEQLKDQAARYVLFNFRVFKRIKDEKQRKKDEAEAQDPKKKKVVRGGTMRKTPTVGITSANVKESTMTIKPSMAKTLDTPSSIAESSISISTPMNDFARTTPQRSMTKVSQPKSLLKGANDKDGIQRINTDKSVVKFAIDA